MRIRPSSLSNAISACTGLPSAPAFRERSRRPNAWVSQRRALSRSAYNKYGEIRGKPMTIPLGVVREGDLSRAEGADDQLGVRIEPDREVAAADATADDEGAASCDVKPALSVAARQGATGAQDRSSIWKCDLTAVCVPRESDIELLVGLEQQAVRGVCQEDANGTGARERFGHSDGSCPGVIDATNGDLVEGRWQGAVAVDQHLRSCRNELALDVVVVGPEVVLAENCVFSQRRLTS